MRNTHTLEYSPADKFLRLHKFLHLHKFLLAACLLVAANVCAPSLFAQTTATTTTDTTSTNSGRVADARGASMAGASLTLYARALQLQRLTASTDANGANRFERLAAGEYLIESDACGFAPAVAGRVRVERGQTTTHDFALEAAGVSAEVVVTAADTPQRIGRRLLFNFNLTASSSYLASIFNPSTFGSVVYRFDGIRKADAGANYTLPLTGSRALRFFGYVENLFGREYLENGFSTPGRTGKAGAQFNF